MFRELLKHFKIYVKKNNRSSQNRKYYQMKLFFTCLSVIFLSAFSSKDYPVATIYAFRQKINKGANFASPEKNKPSTVYQVFIEVKKERRITLTSVWINGKKISFETKEVNTPVTYERSTKLNVKAKAEQEILIPATKNNLLQVILNDSDEQISISPAYKNYTLLIAYKERSKLYYIGRKTWNELPPQVMQ